jgi:hypothetical protein
MKHLRELQLRFQDYLIDGSIDIEQDIVSTNHALAEHRLGTYYNAYRIRLIDSLAIDYSTLEKYLGREAFENMALDYLQRYPSTHPSVRWFGQNLPAYLQDFNHGDNAEFVQELASYEWTRTMVFDAADSEQLFQLEEMAQVPAAAWPGLSFNFQPAMRWLDLYWNVPLIERALDAGTELPLLQRADYPQRWLLWRQDLKTHWRSLEVHEAWAIEQAANGAHFAEICEGLLEWIDEQQVALVAAGFLKQWVSDKLVANLRHKY